MQNNDSIPDRLDAAVRQMLMNCQALDPAPSDYLVFSNPAEKEAQWFVLVFFQESTQLNEAIRTGVCYQIHQYLLSNLDHIDDFKDLKTAIFFESGSVPNEEKSLVEVISNAYEKLAALTKEVEQSDPKICGLCSHDFEKHQMVGIPDETKGIPLAGWMVCPEAHCNCFRTWSFTYNRTTDHR